MYRLIPVIVILTTCLAGCSTPPPAPVLPPPPVVAPAPPPPSFTLAPQPPSALTPMQAIEGAAANTEGVSGPFEMTVRNSGTGITSGEAGYVFLNSEADYRDQRCLTVAITAAAAREFRKSGINPEIYFKSRVIHVSGTARRETVYFYSKGVRTALYYFQTQVLVTSPDQITLMP